MDFELNAGQRAWQSKARAFAEDEIRPLSPAREVIADPVKTFDWEIIKKGSQPGFRTAVLPKEWGGHGIDHVTQALAMSELARADSAISKTFSPCWKFSHRIARSCTPDQRERFLTPFLQDETFVIGGASIEPNAGSDNWLQPENDPRAGLKLRAERQGDDCLLSGDKCFVANGSVAKLFFISTRTNPEVKLREGNTVFLLPRSTPGFRHAKVFNKAAWRFYQNAELILENVRLPHANVVGEVNGGLKTRTSGSLDFSDFELAANALGNCDAAVESAMQHARQDGLASQQRVQLQLAELLTRTLGPASITCLPLKTAGVYPDIPLFYHRAPFFDFAFEQILQCLGAAGNRFKTFARHPFFHIRQMNCAVDLALPALHHILG